MGILLGFAPFILFALLTSVSVSLALWVAFAAAFAITIRDFAHSKSLRALDVTSVVLFGLTALIVGFIVPSLTIMGMRLVIDGGLLTVTLISVLIFRPVTLPYARDQVAPEHWNDPAFLRTNVIVTLVWALAFALMTLADGLAVFNQALPMSLDVAAGFAALALAIVFTARYPAYARTHAARG